MDRATILSNFIKKFAHIVADEKKVYSITFCTPPKEHHLSALKQVIESEADIIEWNKHSFFCYTQSDVAEIVFLMSDPSDVEYIIVPIGEHYHGNLDEPIVDWLAPRLEKLVRRNG